MLVNPWITIRHVLIRPKISEKVKCFSSSEPQYKHRTLGLVTKENICIQIIYTTTVYHMENKHFDHAVFQFHCSGGSDKVNSVDNLRLDTVQFHFKFHLISIWFNE